VKQSANLALVNLEKETFDAEEEKGQGAAGKKKK